MSDILGPPQGHGSRQSDMDRRRRSDKKKREAGCVRLHAWVKAERLDDLDALMQTWGFGDRAEAIDVAIRFLLKQSRSISRIDV